MSVAGNTNLPIREDDGTPRTSMWNLLLCGKKKQATDKENTLASSADSMLY